MLKQTLRVFNLIMRFIFVYDVSASDDHTGKFHIFALNVNFWVILKLILPFLVKLAFSSNSMPYITPKIKLIILVLYFLSIAILP